MNNLGAGDLETAIQHLKAGDILKVDLIKVLLDYESEDDIIAAGADLDKHSAYGAVEATPGFIGHLLTYDLRYIKNTFGTAAVFPVIYHAMRKRQVWTYDIEFDHGTYCLKDVQAQLI